MEFTACIFVFIVKTPGKYLGNSEIYNCLHFEVATETLGLQLILLWQETLRYISVHKQRRISSSAKYASTLILMQSEAQICLSQRTTVEKNLTFSPMI